MTSNWINNKAPVTKKEEEKLANTRIYMPCFGDLKELTKNKKKRREESAYMNFSHTNMQKQKLLSSYGNVVPKEIEIKQERSPTHCHFRPRFSVTEKACPNFADHLEETKSPVTSESTFGMQ